MTPRSLVILVATVLWIGLAAAALAGRTPLDWRFAVGRDDARATALPAFFEDLVDFAKPSGQAHSPSLDEPVPGRLELIWFDGTREGARDVVLRRLALEPARRAAPITDPAAAETVVDAAGLNRLVGPRQRVRKIGNSVAASFPDGSRRLWVTVASVGGWAFSKVLDLPLDAAGAPTGTGRVLPLGPFLDRSFLVRAPAVAYRDGSLGLPLYHEMIGRFGEYVRLAPDGRVLAKSRMGRGISGIQPVVVPLDERRAVAFLRNYYGRKDGLLVSRTDDGGRTWSAPRPLDVPSRNSPAAALRLASGAILLVCTEAAGLRDRMVMALSRDGGERFDRLARLEDGTARPGETRYPSMIRLADGSIALAYSTRSKTGLRLVRFSEAWVAARRPETDAP